MCEVNNAEIARYTQRRINGSALLNPKFRTVEAETVHFQRQLQVTRGVITNYS